MPSMRRVLIPLAVVFSIFLACGGVWYAVHYVPADFPYRVEREVDEGTPTDVGLEQWMQAQAGVWRAGGKRRASGARWQLVVIVGMTQNQLHEPPFPDLDAKCAELGYRGQQGPFRDQPR